MNAVPSLSVAGWIKNPANVINKLYEYFLTSKYSQSNTYNGYISSLSYILQRYKGITDIQDAIQKTLYSMYIRHFPTVNVYVTYVEKPDSVVYVVDLTVITTDGNSYTLNQSMNTVGNNIVNMDTLLTNLYNIQ